MSLISLLVFLIIACLLFWAVRAILKAFKIEDPVAGVVQVLAVVFIVLWLLNEFGLMGSGPILRVR